MAREEGKHPMQSEEAETERGKHGTEGKKGGSHSVHDAGLALIRPASFQT